MKLASFSDGVASRIGIITDAGIIDVRRYLPDAPTDMKEIIARWDQFKTSFEGIAGRPADRPATNTSLRAPIAKPDKVLCVGLNYADHAAEAGLELPQHQIWFCKVPSSVAGPFDDIALPVVSDQLDYEAELVMVIGKRCRNVPRERAKEVIFGFCAGNDVSVRDWQRRTNQFFLGKSFDGHAPFGPWITTADAIDPHNLAITCAVNGAVRQNSNTSHLIFDCYDQIAYVTQVRTIEPGDIVFTGTPGGVGVAFKPPRFLKVGDRVRVEIEKLGAIEGLVKRGTGAALIA